MCLCCLVWSELDGGFILNLNKGWDSSLFPFQIRIRNYGFVYLIFSLKKREKKIFLTDNILLLYKKKAQAFPSVSTKFGFSIVSQISY